MLIFGPRIFWFRWESDKSMMVKLHGTKKKNKIVGSFNGISTTCKLQMDFFFSQLRVG